MEQIFELIFQNFFFVAIVIGGIFSMLNKKANKGQQEQQQGQHPQQQRPRQGKVDWREIFKQEEFQGPKTIQNQSPPAVQVDKIDTNLAEKEQLQNRRNKEVKRRPVEISERLKVDRNIGNSASESLNLQLDRLKGTEAMKAIVLAEVLGAPRSKQSYASNYPRRMK